MHDVEETQDIVILRLHIEGSFSICVVNPMVCELWKSMDVLFVYLHQNLTKTSAILTHNIMI